MKIWGAILTSSVLVLGSGSVFGQVVAGPYQGPVQQPTGPGVIVQGTVPRVVSSNPYNGQQDVGTRVKRIEITFDQPMDVATFYYPIANYQGGNGDIPQITADPFWTNGDRTVVFPVNLLANRTYRLPLNVGNTAFRSAQGVALQPGVISFRTVYGGGTVANPAAVGVTPGGVTTARNTPRVPGEGGIMGGSNRTQSGNVGGGSVSRTPAQGLDPFMGQQSTTSNNKPAVRGKVSGSSTRVRNTPTPVPQR